MRDGDHNRLPDEEITTSDSGIRYLRAQDLKEGTIIADEPVFITERYFATVSRSHIRPGYLLFSIMASVGNSAVVPEGFPRATANRAVGILVPKHEDPSLTWYLFYLFSTEFGTELYTRIKKGGLQQRTNLADVEMLEFPLPPETKRTELVAAMDAAREQRRAKMAEADALLAGLDDYLLATLKLTPPPKDDRKVFAVQHAMIPNRFDPHFYSPELMRNQRMLAEAGAETLGSQISFSTEIWKPETHDEPVFRYIEISSVSPQTGEAVAEETAVAEAPSRARMMVRTGDIIVSLTRPHHGSIAQITPELDGCIASTGFAVLRNVGKQLDRDYLWCILRSSICLKQMQQRASGGNYPAITEHELANVAIPVPPIPVQTAIAAESRRRRETARTLRAEADSLWHSAKQEFERQLLGSRSIASQ